MEFYGNPIAERAFILYSDMVFRLAYSRCGASRADAEDIMIEVFIRLTKSKNTFESDEHLKAWLIKVTINRTKSLLSSAWHCHTVELTDSIISQDSDLSQTDIDVYNAVMKLPQNIRSAIHLFYYEELTIAQIAEIMQVKEGTVKSWLSRGRDKLRSYLGDTEM